MKFIFNILNILNILFFIFLISISLYAIKIFNDAPDIEFRNMKQNTNLLIYDEDYNLINDTIYYQQDISINEVSINVINALLSIEDSNFYDHNGISMKRILSSMLNNLKDQSFSQGASTINQQIIKNLFLSSDKTIKRKLQEIYLACLLDYNLTKDQILELYLNNVLFGGSIYGIKAASLYYFDKEPIDLTINESATLAGVLQSPNYYNPYNNYDECITRRNIVLKQMYNNNHIDLDTYNNLILDDIVLSNNIYLQNNNYCNNFIDYTLDYLDTSGVSEIYTSLDTSMQKYLYDISQNVYNHFTDDTLKCAMVVIDNKTSKLKAMIGNRQSDRLVLNYATIKNQPGSTIKPILDYAPAFEYLNYSPADVIIDEPYTYSCNTPITNWDNLYKGSMTIRKALSQSRNIPAYKIFKEVGDELAFDFASRLNIVPIDHYEAESLGGSTLGYSILQLANAYTAFANDGIFKEVSPINHIYKLNENITLDQRKIIAMKPSTAFLINDILHDVFKYSNYDLKNGYLMAKTGQTNYDTQTRIKYNIPIGAVKDSLVMAYTYEYTLGIWCGYDNLDNYLTYETKNIPRQIMYDFFTKFNENYIYKSPPSNIIKKNVSIIDNQLYLSNDSNSFSDYFILGSEPLSYYNKAFMA